MSDDRSSGLYGKYIVKRAHDPEGKHDHCDYFVLDLVHDRHARAALLAYADSAERDGYGQLARDLRARVESMPTTPAEVVRGGEGSGACFCGSGSYDITATLMTCVECGTAWGRVNGVWVLDPDSVPEELR